MTDNSYHDEPTEPDQAEEIHDYSSTGLCPMCGVELEELTEEEWRGDFDTIYCTVTTQRCPSCEWQSVELYDV